eukprot:3567931-Rhodomonas_salina.1
MSRRPASKALPSESVFCPSAAAGIPLIAADRCASCPPHTRTPAHPPRTSHTTPASPRTDNATATGERERERERER